MPAQAVNPIPSPDPHKLLGRVGELPALPEVVNELMRCLDDAGTAQDQLAEKLSRDPALSMKALRLANSSFYGLSREILSIPEALKVLGRRTVSLLVLAAAASDALQVPPHSGLDFRAFWRHALGTALCGQALARCLQLPSDAGFTVGLLHDVGQLALACLVPDDYARVRAHQQSEDIPILQAERHLLGTDHAEIGALLAERWNLAPHIIDAIASHHQPTLQHSRGLVGLTHMSDAISHALGLSGADGEAVPLTPPDLWQAMFPEQETCMALFSEVESQFKSVCSALHV
ncbi:MAG: HDOD domain-containing protein [Aquabacterium sp.]